MNGQTQPYQPLTSENAALVLVDHQVGLMTGVDQVAQTPGGIGYNAAVVVGRVVKLNGPSRVTLTSAPPICSATSP
jgi:hypothetical protein